MRNLGGRRAEADVEGDGGDDDDDGEDDNDQEAPAGTIMIASAFFAAAVFSSLVANGDVSCRAVVEREEVGGADFRVLASADCSLSSPAATVATDVGSKQ